MSLARSQTVTSLHGPTSTSHSHPEPHEPITNGHGHLPQRATPHSQEDYLRWRPAYHVLPPYGWANDPCAPGYDPTTGLYHLAFQWNPKSAEWADISWGHCVSEDLVHWRAVNGPGTWDGMVTALAPKEPYDHEGVYTGCFVPEGPKGEKDVITVVYTSVSHSPIHYTLPYVRGSESLSIATSCDSGRTWTRLPCNPILPGAPEKLSVRAWRDPFVSPWPALSRVLGGQESARYGIISGSIENEGPNVFLHQVADGDMTKWTFLNSLVRFPLGRPPASTWTGDVGRNWEVCNFLPHLQSPSHPNRVYMTMSVEGTRRWGMKEGEVPRKGEAGRVPRWNLWMAARVKKDAKGQPIVEHEFGGVLDHGCFYAANSFWDPVKERTIAWGWIVEDDLPPSLRDAQAWAGVISLPRELFIQRIPHVVGTLRTPLSDIGSFAATPDGRSSYTVETLGIRPLNEMQLLRKGEARETRFGQVELCPRRSVFSLGSPGKFWEFEGKLEVRQGVTGVGLYVRHFADMRQFTELSFTPQTETITVSHIMPPSAAVRSRPTDEGRHTLFTYADGTIEKLHIRVFCDNSVLEVFANDRFAMSSRMYPGEHADGLTLFMEGEHAVTWEDVTVWTGLHGGGV